MPIPDGFQFKFEGVSAILCGALSAFGVLSHAVEGIELSMAGGVRGEVGLIAMAIFGIALFGQCLRFRGGWGWG
ncbi:SMR family transporter [Dyella flava]|uniref:Uncharacterized protein n=1 Tax=Dyella flava TaxID=1920170 RepID=A0ABS2K511_9GAMM|nr:hypothetical protein [Dyella flava]